jgi:LmbE family N-acetylglucosaminyl deacetylase
MKSLPPTNQQRILAVYAHPDDECYCSGGVLAQYSADGAETTVISATKGQAGQINDTRVATRHTLGAMREQELYRSCEQLNVQNVECWNYLDGALKDADQNQLVGDITRAMRKYRPHIVITFGPDGAYGHPDHIAIGEATTTAFYCAGDPEAHIDNSAMPHQPDRLYYAHFPERQALLLNQLAKWLASQQERFHGTLDFVHGLSLFAEESTMLHYANDFVDIRWYPPGFCIVEQGEVANDLFVILSGNVEVQREEQDGALTHLGDLTMGQFFGETGLVVSHHKRNAHVVARDAVTCLVFSPGEPTKFAGRGEGAVFGGAHNAQNTNANTGNATHVINIEKYIRNKINAISQHRTQYPIKPDMFPESMLRELFGREYFVRVYPPIELETSL